MKNLIKRGSNYTLKKRVPLRFQSIEPRETVWVSLHTDSETDARAKAEIVWLEIINGWEARLAGDAGDADRHFEAVNLLAGAKGFRYLPSSRVANLPADELLTRIEAITIRGGSPDQVDASALLGGPEEPAITVTQALEIFWKVAKDETLRKSPDQIRRWKNPRIKAFKNFVMVIGDKPINQITGDDMLDFRAWWMEKIEAEELTANSANKDLVHFGKVLKTVNILKRLHLDLPLSGLHIKEGEQNTRPPFSVGWITSKLLAPNALDGMNIEARSIFIAMINTGARPSELANLLPQHIRLDHEYPHIVITPVKRELKSRSAKRNIPLIGCSLEAMRCCPDGFPRYRDKPDLSATTNKFLRENGLMETPEHVAYSVRHAFEDRLRNAQIDERLRSELFGHAYYREKYGEPKLDELTKAIQKVAV